MTAERLKEIATSVISERGQICSVAYIQQVGSSSQWDICIHCIDGKLHHFTVAVEEGESSDSLKSKIKNELGEYQPVETN